MNYKLVIVVFLTLGFLSLNLFISPYGIDTAAPIGKFVNNNFPANSPALGDWKVENAFEGLTFKDPLALVQITPDQGFYVAEKVGRIQIVQYNGTEWTKTEALDINEKVITSGDAGLINIITHPKFSESDGQHRFVYAYYAYHPEIPTGEIGRVNRLVRYETFPNSLILDPDSEFILIQDYDPQGYHMGGGMFFDNEGYFYITQGDGGESNDIFNSSQQITERFWGGLLRIDLDNDPSRSHPIRRNIIDYPGKPDLLPDAITQGYMIPNDNPWVDEEGRYLEEFYAIGLRSPHRATYDPVTGDIWVGDVAQGKDEEITVLKKGSNAQWPFREGKSSGTKPRPDSLIGFETPPTFSYDRSNGNAIIGGFMYRGNKWSQELDSRYIYGDHGSRNVWSLDPASNETELMLVVPEFGSGSKSGISSFAEDLEGNVYILKLYGKDQDGGIIYRLEKEASEPADIPTLLSETGAFSDLQDLVPAEGFIPYEPISQLWSDGASKKRWVALPNDGSFDAPDEKIFFDEQGEWIFPKGTVFIKHFDLPLDRRNPDITRKIETRFFIIDDEGAGYGLTYRWFDDESDAYLLETGENRIVDIVDEFGLETQQTWEYPSRSQCLTCHNQNASYVLGVKTWQLNNLLDYGQGVSSNQLATWNHLEIFHRDIDESLIPAMPAGVSIDDDNASETNKVISYLAANCSYCHRPDGVEGAFDARFNTSILNKNLIRAVGKSHNNPPDGIIVEPGSHQESQLWLRDASISRDKMPPLGKTIADDTWVNTLASWIDELDAPCLWHYASKQVILDNSNNGFGPIEIDQSVGNVGSNDGKTMSINGREFFYGLGVHAESNVYFNVEKKYKQFNSFIGVDDETCDRASVQFQVYVDGILKYTSSTMTSSDDAQFVSVDVEGGEIIRLSVKSFNDFNECDHANWADAKFLISRDSDGDGVCDDLDQCEGADDYLDINSDGIPDGCEKVTTGGDFDIRVSPNPSASDFIISVPVPDFLIGRANIEINDLFGRTVYSNDQFLFDTQYRLGGNFQPGTYIVRIKSGAFYGIKKFQKL